MRVLDVAVCGTGGAEIVHAVTDAACREGKAKLAANRGLDRNPIDR